MRPAPQMSFGARTGTRLERPITRSTVIAAAVAVVLVVGGFVTCAIGLDHRSDIRAAENDRRAVAAQAADAVVHVFSVSDESWRQDRRTAKSYLTEPMSTSIAPALEAGPPGGVRSVEWEALHTAPVDVDGDSATALVVARVRLTPRDGQVRTADRTVQASLTRVGDQWLMAGMDELR